MSNKFTHSWHYHLVQIDNSFSLYFNDRLIAIITKPSSGHWPVHATINEKMYSFSKKNLLDTAVHITDAMTGEKVGVIKMPFLSAVFSRATIRLHNGEDYTWYTNNFFSLHWKWKKGNDSVVDAIDNLAAKKHNGVIAIQEYKSGTDLLIIAGFFLSLLKRSKLSLGIRGLKRRGMPISKIES
jgi:hypothetical protein